MCKQACRGGAKRATSRFSAQVGKIRAFGLWIRNVMAVHSSSRVAKLPHEQRIPLKSVEYARFFKNHQLHELFPDGWPYVADKKYFKAALDLVRPLPRPTVTVLSWCTAAGRAR